MYNKPKPKSSYDEINEMLKRTKVFNDRVKLLKEVDLKLPNVQSNFKQDIDEFKQTMDKYVIDIDEKNSHRILSNDNIMLMGSANIKGIQLRWSYSMDENGCTIYFPRNTESVPLYNDLIQFLSDLKQYYGVWKNKWAKIITDSAQ